MRRKDLFGHLELPYSSSQWTLFPYIRKLAFWLSLVGFKGMKKWMVPLATSSNEATTTPLAFVRKMCFHQTNITQSLNRYKFFPFQIQLFLEFITLLHRVAIFATEEALNLRCSSLFAILFTRHRFFSKDLVNKGAFHWFVRESRPVLLIVVPNVDQSTVFCVCQLGLFTTNLVRAAKSGSVF